MKKPITVKELVWKYMALSSEQKDLFGSDSVVPADDLVNALHIAEGSMKINCEIVVQCSLLIKFLIDNRLKLESQEFHVLINNVNVSLDKLTVESKLLKSKYEGVG